VLSRREITNHAIGILTGGALIWAIAACGGKEPAAQGTVAATGAGDPRRGRSVYMATCISCHNPDPAKEGTLGPAVAGASLELLEARILRAEYPPGYAPKRPTALMPKQPQLAADIPHLAAYLAH
jgi:mono/diheme cytochrome c family protein